MKSAFQQRSFRLVACIACACVSNAKADTLDLDVAKLPVARSGASAKIPGSLICCVGGLIGVVTAFTLYQQCNGDSKSTSPKSTSNSTKAKDADSTKEKDATTDTQATSANTSETVDQDRETEVVKKIRGEIDQQFISNSEYHVMWKHNGSQVMFPRCIPGRKYPPKDSTEMTSTPTEFQNGFLSELRKYLQNDNNTERVFLASPGGSKIGRVMAMAVHIDSKDKLAQHNGKKYLAGELSFDGNNQAMAAGVKLQLLHEANEKDFHKLFTRIELERKNDFDPALFFCKPGTSGLWVAIKA